MLKLKSINAYYDQVHVLKNVSLHVSPKEIVALLGANGAGKSTLLNLVSGLVKKMDGEVLFEEEKIAKLGPHKIVRRGISQVPEGRQIFNPLSVLDNLKLGSYHRFRRGKKRPLMGIWKIYFLCFPFCTSADICRQAI